MKSSGRCSLLAAIYGGVRISLDGQQILLAVAAVHDCGIGYCDFAPRPQAHVASDLDRGRVCAVRDYAEPRLRYMLPAIRLSRLARRSVSTLQERAAKRVACTGASSRGRCRRNRVISAGDSARDGDPADRLGRDRRDRENELVSFYDEGQPRIDELNQMLWYGDRLIVLLFDRDMLLEALRNPRSRIFVVDKETYRDYIDSRVSNQVVLESGHLVCVRLCGSDGLGCDGSPFRGAEIGIWATPLVPYLWSESLRG